MSENGELRESSDPAANEDAEPAVGPDRESEGAGTDPARGEESERGS
jgi:hypothetical protein